MAGRGAKAAWGTGEIAVLEAWAKASGRYEGNAEDPAKWKTNFRCALRSTHMFMLLEDRSKCNDDPHKVYAVASGEPGPLPAELRDFRDSRRERSPDFTIFLCFGQCFSSTKPKESKLILVKLVPQFCEYWYEQVQRGGASSLNSGNVSLQLSDSFNLFELIEQYHMQTD